MKIVTKPNDLIKALGYAGSIYTRKVEECDFLLDASFGTLKLASANKEAYVRISALVEVQVEGALRLPARKLLEILKGADAENVMVIASKGSDANISSGKMKWTLKAATGSVADFPKLKEAKDAQVLTVSAVELKNALIAAKKVLSDEPAKGIKGVLFHFKGKELTIVGTDGSRLCLSRIGTEGASFDEELRLPLAAIVTVLPGLFPDEGRVALKVSVQGVLFEALGKDVWVQSLSIAYPAYEQILQVPETRTEVETNKAALIKATKRALVMAKEGSNNVLNVQLSEGFIRLSAESHYGAVAEEIEARTFGDAALLVNGRFLQDAVESIPDETVKLICQGGENPLFFWGESGPEKRLHLLAAVRS